MKQRTDTIQGQVDKLIIIVIDFSIISSVIDKPTDKNNKDREDTAALY